MENSKELQTIVELIQHSGHVSESLILCHNLITHQIPLEQFTGDVQTALYYLYQTAQALQPLEEEMFPEESGRVLELKKLISEQAAQIGKLRKGIDEKSK